MQARNVRAFDTFVDRHQGPLLAFASSILRDETSAQDVVQEVFLRVARYPNRLIRSCASQTSNTRRERNWLLKVARDLSIDSLRRRKNEDKALRQIAATSDRTTPDAKEVAEGSERRAAVSNAIENLKPRLRELVILKVREQKSYKEIAQITGLSVTNVGFLLHQAMKEMGRRMKAEG